MIGYLRSNTDRTAPAQWYL